MYNDLRGDTTIFTRSNFGGVKTISFDDNNIINVSEKKLKLIVKEETEDKYTLFVELNNKNIMTRRHISGISKVWLNQNRLTFSIFTYSDEDGNNEGNGYVINLADGSFVTLPKKLKNTCNPLVLDNCLYFVDGLSLIKTDMKCNILKTFYLAYINRVKPKYTYLDNYSISEISANRLDLIIFFSPNKSVKCQPYSGVINKKSNFIVIKN